MRLNRPLAILLLCAACTQACDNAPAVTTEVPATTAPTAAPPSVAISNAPIGFVVGQAVTYDATRGGTVFTAPPGVTYRITFDGASNGLSAIGSTITGTLLAPNVTWVTIVATDALGRTRTHRT